MSDWVFAARERGRHRAGAAPGETVYVCRACGATHRRESSLTCGSTDCERELERYAAELLCGEERSLGWAHNPAVPGSTPGAATSSSSSASSRGAQR